MKKKLFKLLLIGLLAIPTIFTIGCKDDNDDDDNTPPVEQKYIGSAECKACHEAIYNDFINTGHPYKLNKVNGAAPTYPSFVTNPPTTTPTGWTWADVTYVIGGFAWKARFVDSEGYIVTGDEVQYNLIDKSWSGYHASEAPGTKPYNCGKCHTTGWVATDSFGQDNLQGMAGTFSEGGVHCEACHGMGNQHKESKSASDITIDLTSAACGSCHYRNEDHTIAAKGGFIRHHEQYDEMISAGHTALTCVTCHDPHKTVKHGQTGGLLKDCLDCHDGSSAKAITNNTSHNGATCVTCHLPMATKSAKSVTKYKGDVKTHIFKINPSETGNTFNADTTLAVGSTGVSLHFVCYQCHKDSDNVGGSMSQKTMTELSTKATGFHN